MHGRMGHPVVSRHDECKSILNSSEFQHGLLSTVSNIVKAANADSARVREDLLGADLPAKIISKVKRSSEDGGMDTSCVQLFICRMSPIIWGLQVGFHFKYHWNYSICCLRDVILKLVRDLSSSR